MAPRQQPLPERFWSKVEKRGPEQCWPWMAAKTWLGGYGAFSVSKKMLRAHRVAYELSVGPIPTGLVVMHTCDNPPCCNPAHLKTGTKAENFHDMVLKGRSEKSRAFFEYLKANHPEMVRTSTRG